MSYLAIFSSRAEDDIRRMPYRLGQFTLTQLAALEQTPTALSERSRVPYREQCQLFAFDFDEGGTRFRIDITFQYGSDEQTLHISDVHWHLDDQHAAGD